MNGDLFAVILDLGSGALRLVPYCKNTLAKARDILVGLVTLADIAAVMTDSSRRKRD